MIAQSYGKVIQKDVEIKEVAESDEDSDILECDLNERDEFDDFDFDEDQIIQAEVNFLKVEN